MQKPRRSMFELLLEASWLRDDRYKNVLQVELNSLGIPFPEKRLLSFLPISSLLALRLVSKITKTWVENGPRSVFSTLYLRFPFKSKEYTANPRVPSRQASRMCEKLIVNVTTSEIPLRTMYNIFWGAGTLPTYSSLTHLHVNSPSSNSFWPLLELRMFVQAVDLPLLRRFTINGLSIEGIKALRWGPLTSYLDADWTSTVIWRQLTNLDICLAPSMGVVDLGRSEEGMQAMKILHDWIGSFNENIFEKVRFEWMEDQQRPNPFLLDELMELSRSEGESKLQQIRWKSCKEIWLGGIRLGGKDLKKMTKRVRGLRKLMIWTSLLGRKTKAGERKVYSRGQEWVMIKMSDTRQNETHLTNRNPIQHDAFEEIVREYCEETEPQVSNGQTLEDWNVDEMSEGRGVGETFYADSDDNLSDGSREVPIFLDFM